METKTETPFGLRQRMALGWAIESLGKACFCPWNNEVINNVKRARQNIDKFLGEVIPVPTFDEKTAELSANIHIFLRKACDGPLSVILYRMISENRGMVIWLSFCKHLLKNKMNFNDSLNDMLKETDNFDSTDEIIMKKSIELFEDDFKYFKEWNK